MRRKGNPDTASPAGPLPNRWLVWIEILSALASLFSLLCLVAIALLPNLIYIPWSRPYADLLWWQFGILIFLFASLLLAVLIALLAGPITSSHAWVRRTRLYYLSVALALLAFNMAIIL